MKWRVNIFMLCSGCWLPARAEENPQRHQGVFSTTWELFTNWNQWSVFDIFVLYVCMYVCESFCVHVSPSTLTSRAPTSSSTIRVKSNWVRGRSEMSCWRVGTAQWHRRVEHVLSNICVSHWLDLYLYLLWLILLSRSLFSLLSLL